MKTILKFIIPFIILGLLLAYFFTEFFLEFWWFRSLKLGTFFLLRESYAALVSVASTIIISLIVYLNLVSIPSLSSNFKNSSIDFLQQHTKTAWLISFIIAIPILIPIYDHWEDFLLFYFSTQSKLTDPAYAKNISYYLFSYPVYQLIQTQLLWFFSILLALVSYLYFWPHKKSNAKQAFPLFAKIHIALLVLVLVALQAWSIALERIELLYEDRHLPVFYGPGFVEMNYHLSLIWISFILFMFFIIVSIYSLYAGKQRKLAMFLGLVYIVILLVKQIEFIPTMIDNYYVGSNPVDAESKYIKNHIKATTDAFNFADITTINYPITQTLTANTSREIRRELHNIPLWDKDLLLPVYNQLQSIRTYFNFNQVSVDRYRIDNHNQQVNVAARELDFQNLPVDAQNWRNQHLVYTHGYGMLMSPSAQEPNKPMQWLRHNFRQSIQSERLKLKQAEIYYGLADYPYAIVPNNENVKTDTKTTGDLNTDYNGTGGLPLSSVFEKLLVSSFFRDSRIFFSTGINKKSRILVRRNIYKRIKAIAPFLYIDKNAQPVLINKKIYWIVDAYTYSNHYPLVQPITLNQSGEQDKTFNYARNSVKIIVDAYNGSIDFYAVDQQDPLIKTYQRIYPGLFQDITNCPKEFIKHFSYPKDWFRLQMKLYSRFHQKDPIKFYRQSEALEFSKKDDKEAPPYYLTFDIEELVNTSADERQKFVLVNPFTPLNRENLNSIAIAGCLKTIHCNNHYQDDIFIYKFPDYQQIEGPAQISSLMNQNPDISRQFTLWNQKGSKIIRGRMIIIPVEHSLLYIQPLYLAANSNQGFPSLTKVIVAMNRSTVIAESLPLAFEQLQQKLNSVQ